MVLTNDGSRFEGELVERVVGDHVTIKLVTGEIRVIPAATIKAEWRHGQHPQGAVEGPGPTVVIQPSLPLVVGADGPLVYRGPDAIQIHLTNANNTSGTLYAESTSGWQTVCEMPCSTTVDPKVSYKLHNSDPFRFPAGARSLNLVVDYSARRRSQVLGWLMFGLGGAAFVGGAAFFAVGATGPQPGTTTCSDCSGFQTGGEIAMVAGGVLMATGLVIALSAPSTVIATTSGERIAKAPSIRLPGSLRLTPSGFVF